jgi:thioesterase domain-containing protein
MVLQIQPHLEQYLHILSDEVGISCDDLENDTEFSDLGIDRILAHAIIEKINQVTHTRLPDGLFECATNVQEFVDQLEKIIPQDDRFGNKPPSGILNVSNGQKTHVEQSCRVRAEPEKLSSKTPLILRLQGSHTAGSKCVFFMPDGSGSAMSYARMAPLGKDWVLYGLNSPCLGTASTKITIPGLASLWTEKIMEMQRQGPYILGGWSAGGYYLTEVARLLLERGERVETLIIIDSPCRLEYGAPPTQLFQFLADKGLMGNFPKGAPEWLMKHFAGTMAAVSEYHPAPVARVQKIYIIEAEKGVLKSEKEAVGSGLDLSTGVTRMLLLRKRTDSLCGWDRQFPDAKVRWSTTSGSHFSLVHPPHVNALSNLVREVINGDADRVDHWSLWTSRPGKQVCKN